MTLEGNGAREGRLWVRERDGCEGIGQWFWLKVRIKNGDSNSGLRNSEDKGERRKSSTLKLLIDEG